MDSQALVPDLPVLSDESIEPNKPAEQVIEADTKTAEMLATDTGRHIIAILDRHIESFRTGKGLTIDANTPLEEIGKKFVIASTIAQICEDIKADIINAANSVVANGHGNQ